MVTLSVVGQCLNNRFRIAEQLGEGGYGVVYLAEDEWLQRTVAVKVLKLNEEHTEEFLKEARTLARFDHPHILPIYDIDSHMLGDQKLFYFVVRRAEGGSLAQQMQNGELSEERIQDIFVQLCDALAYIHAEGVLHLDIKPANILFDANQNVLLADFGVARLLTQQSTETKAATGVGTPAYMPPEQFFGVKVGPYSDVYALGAVLHHLLSGETPQRSFEQGRLVLQLEEALPTRYRAIIEKAVSVDPQQRYRTVGGFRQALVEASARTLAVT